MRTFTPPRTYKNSTKYPAEIDGTVKILQTKEKRFSFILFFLTHLILLDLNLQTCLYTFTYTF